MAIPNYYGEQNACVQGTAKDCEQLTTILNSLSDYARAANQRARDIEARLFGQPGNPGPPIGQDQNKLRPVQSVLDIATEARSLIGQTCDALDRIQGQL